MPYIENTLINRDLVLNFFLTLSRLEFALKITGYVRGNEDGVEPDWDRFARDISNSFDIKKNDSLVEAVYYYLGHPPQKQVLIDGSLDWVPAVPNGGSEIQRALILVRRVRNNLFHGGKYNYQRHEETERNEALLSMGITILREVMDSQPRIQAAYQGAAI
jgi:hypothetical protein